MSDQTVEMTAATFEHAVGQPGVVAHEPIPGDGREYHEAPDGVVFTKDTTAADGTPRYFRSAPFRAP